MPASVLFLLSPAIGELLSSSAPPAEFFHPLGLTAPVFLLWLGRRVKRREKGMKNQEKSVTNPP